LKFIVSILIFLFSFINISTGQNYIQKSAYNPISYIDWRISNNGCYPIYEEDYYTCASFYWKIDVSEFQDKDGYYYFDIWLYSNSYIWDYNNNKAIWMSTYLWGVNLYIDNKKLTTEPVWLMFKDSYSPPLLRFKAKNPKPIIEITYQGKKIS